MAINFAKTDYSGHAPEIWRGEAKILPGGFKPLAAQTIALGTVLHRGTPVYVDMANRTCAICKTATIITGGTTTAVRVGKGHLFAAGDKVTISGGSATGEVASVDSSNSSYDVITLKAALTGATANAILIEGTTAGTALYEPNAVVGAVKEFDGKGIDVIDVAYDCLVLKDHLKFPILAAWLNGFCLKSNPNILFITQ